MRSMPRFYLPQKAKRLPRKFQDISLVSAAVFLFAVICVNLAANDDDISG